VLVADFGGYSASQVTAEALSFLYILDGNKDEDLLLDWESDFLDVTDNEYSGINIYRYVVDQSSALKDGTTLISYGNRSCEFYCPTQFGRKVCR
jgi:hypothetical protein